jgi:5-methyltetrahydrofolate--homocysteine methyltransferase
MVLEKRGKMQTKLSFKNREVVIGDGQPTRLIGERINPTGRKKLTAALQAGALDIIRKEAVDQVQAGADILDVNVGVAGLDEEALMIEAIKIVMAEVEVPLCLDSAAPKVLEAALKVYEGKALINSVTGEEKSLASVLPLVKEYGAAVIGLAMDEDGIPHEPEQRLAVAAKIVQRAESMGIPRENVIIDCLTMAVGAEAQAGLITLEAIRLVKKELGVNMTLGASNLSFALPDRPLLTNAFLSLVIEAGVNCPIVDALKVRPAVLATDLIRGADPYAMRYVRAYKQRQALAGG